MINFTDGQINLSEEKNIFVVSDYEDLNALAKEGLIEKRNDGVNIGSYYYIEVVEDGMRFGVFISFLQERMHWLVLRWLDGPCTSKGWDGVSEKALKDEYRLLLSFVEKRMGRPPDHKGSRQRTWRCKWGQIDVSYEPRDFAVAVFMKPR